MATGLDFLATFSSSDISTSLGSYNQTKKAYIKSTALCLLIIENVYLCNSSSMTQSYSNLAKKYLFWLYRWINFGAAIFHLHELSILSIFYRVPGFLKLLFYYEKSHRGCQLQTLLVNHAKTKLQAYEIAEHVPKVP